DAQSCEATGACSGVPAVAGDSWISFLDSSEYMLTWTNPSGRGLACVVITVSSATARDGSVAYCYLDDLSETIFTDDSSKRHIGAAIGPAWVQGRLHTALDFDGDGHVEVLDAPSLDLTDDLTLSAWIYPRSLGESDLGRIIDKASEDGTAGYVF